MAEPFWQQFLTSPGLGGLAALAAAVIAYIGVRASGDVTTKIAALKNEHDIELATRQIAANGELERVKADSITAIEQAKVDANERAAAELAKRQAEAMEAADSLQRWWDAAMWLWVNYGKLGPDARLAVLDALESSMVHEAHGGILNALTEVVLDDVEEGSDEPRAR